MVDLKVVKKGDILEHGLSKDWVMMLDTKETVIPNLRMITCRTKSLDIKDFYDFELEYRK